MDDLISRQAAIDAVKKYRNGSDMPDMWYDGMSCALRCLYKLPSAQPERERGRWIQNIYPDVGDGYRCSQCGKWHVVKYNFCHNCGADMREVDDERPD